MLEYARIFAYRTDMNLIGRDGRTDGCTDNPARTNRILNPIPQTNLDSFNISFFSTHSLEIENLTHLLKSHETLSNHQWQEACHALDNIINQISLTLKISSDQIWVTRYFGQPLTYPYFTIFSSDFLCNSLKS
jgi:hypothetical protein